MVVRVLDAVAQAKSTGMVVLCGPPWEEVSLNPVLHERIASGEVKWVENGATPCRSVLHALDDRWCPAPCARHDRGPRPPLGAAHRSLLYRGPQTAGRRGRGSCPSRAGHEQVSRDPAHGLEAQRRGVLLMQPLCLSEPRRAEGPRILAAHGAQAEKARAAGMGRGRDHARAIPPRETVSPAGASEGFRTRSASGLTP